MTRRLEGEYTNREEKLSTIPAGRPKKPTGVTPDALKAWCGWCRQLKARRALTDGDSTILGLAAVLFDRHRRALTKLVEEGEICTYTRLDSNGNAHEAEKPNLWLKVAQDSERNMIAILDRLGLTPRARDWIKPTKKAPRATPSNGYLADLSTEEGEQ